MELFFYAGLVLIGLFAVSYLSERFHLPSILAFILIGIGLGFSYDLPEELKLGGEAGIIVLFFLLGLEVFCCRFNDPVPQCVESRFD